MTYYDVVAGAVNEIADAAREAFIKAGIEPGEWDSDNIVADVKRGIVQSIEALSARSETAPTRTYEDGLEDAAKVCDNAASIYRSMKMDDDGNATEDATAAEEHAYCCDLNAKAIRALKGPRQAIHTGPAESSPSRTAETLAKARASETYRAEAASLEASAHCVVDALREFYESVSQCMDDTTECSCGRSEPWWKDSNADYLTRDAVARIHERNG